MLEPSIPEVIPDTFDDQPVQGKPLVCPAELSVSLAGSNEKRIL